MQFSAREVRAFTELYSTKTEAAAAIGVSRVTLNKMLRRGADTTQTLAMMMAAQMLKEKKMTTASIETTATGLHVYTTIGALERHWSPSEEWGMTGYASAPARERVRLRVRRDASEAIEAAGTDGYEREWVLERESPRLLGWYVALEDLDDDDLAPLLEDSGLSIATLESLEQAFAGYQSADDHLAGFVAWAWDQRHLTLKALAEGELEQLVDDIAYTLDAWARLNGEVSPQLAEDAGACYLSKHREALADAIRDSIS